MDDAEIDKKFDALLAAITALRSSLQKHEKDAHSDIDRQFLLLTKRLSRIEKQIGIRDHGLMLQTLKLVPDRPLTDKRGK